APRPEPRRVVVRVRGRCLAAGCGCLCSDGEVAIPKRRGTRVGALALRCRVRMRTCRSRLTMYVRERRQRIAEDYLNFVRAKPCVLCDRADTNPHHLVSRKWREPARDDFLCVPACPRCHREIHSAALVSAVARHGIAVRYLLGVVADLLVEYFSERDWRANAPL